MLKQNETLPDIEKLGRHEFDLDIEEQNRLQAEADAEVNRVSGQNIKSYLSIYRSIYRSCFFGGNVIQDFFFLINCFIWADFL